jgi:hypothetical protein
MKWRDMCRWQRDSCESSLDAKHKMLVHPGAKELGNKEWSKLTCLPWHSQEMYVDTIDYVPIQDVVAVT